MFDMEAFHEILAKILDKKKLNKNTASKYLKRKGIYIERSTISMYVNCTTVPTHKRAKTILNAFEYEITNKDLEEALELSKQIKKSQNYGNDKYLVTGIRIPFSRLSSIENDSLKIELMLNQRISEVAKITGKKGLIPYITTLIRADIDFGLLDDLLKEGEENEK